jgi:hypothetical protein
MTSGAFARCVATSSCAVICPAHTLRAPDSRQIRRPRRASACCVPLSPSADPRHFRVVGWLSPSDLNSVEGAPQTPSLLIPYSRLVRTPPRQDGVMEPPHPDNGALGGASTPSGEIAFPAR